MMMLLGFFIHRYHLEQQRSNAIEYAKTGLVHYSYASKYYQVSVVNGIQKTFRERARAEHLEKQEYKKHLREAGVKNINIKETSHLILPRFADTDEWMKKYQKYLNRSDLNWKLTKFSDKPLPRPDLKPLDEVQEEVVAHYAKVVASPDYDMTEIESYPYFTKDKEGEKILRYFKPRVMNQACVDCHNNLPDTPKKDWKVGDIRGYNEVEVYLKSSLGGGDGVSKSFRDLNIFAILSILTLLLISLLFLRENTTAFEKLNTIMKLDKRRLEEIDTQRRKAEIASESKSAFIATVSHELRTPMNGIVGMSKLLENTKLNSDQRDRLGVIAESADSLMYIINDLLDFSKYENEGFTLDKHDFKIKAEIDSVINILQTKAREKGLQLEVELSPDTPLVVKGDAMRLKQILMNLVNNAIKFTKRGKIKVEVEPIMQQGGVIKCQFKVSDTGIGIKESFLDSIFDSFTQADSSTTRKYGGTGLGLSICKQLTELMNGEIWVESKVDKGSVFYFTAEFDKPDLSYAPTEVNKTLSYTDKKCLIVDDNKTNGLLLDFILREFGVKEIIFAENGKEAIYVVENQEVDIVFMDIHMPVMDGLEATKEIRKLSEEPSQVKILAMTAAALPEDRQRAKDAGMDGFLTKPIDKVDLSDAIASLYT